MSVHSARRALLAVAAVSLATSACGGGSDETSATTQPTSEFTEDDYVEAGAGAITLGDREQARCLSQAVVDAVGVENLRAQGVTPEEFSENGDITQFGVPVDEAAAALVAGFTQCGDLVEAAIEASELVDPQASCLREFFSNALFAETIIVDLLDVEPSQALTDARTNAQECAGE